MKNLNLINPERRLGGHDFCGVNHANQTEVQTDNLSVSGRSEVSMTLDEQHCNHPVITPLSPRNHPLLPKQKSGKSLIRIGKNVAESHVRKYAGTSRVWKYAAMMVLMVTLGVGQMWARNTYRVYCVPKALWGDSWDDSKGVKAYWGHKSGDKVEESGAPAMTNTGCKIDGNFIYKADLDVPYNGVSWLDFQRFDSNWKYEAATNAIPEWWTSPGFENRMYNGSWNDLNWDKYTISESTTIYFDNTDMAMSSVQLYLGQPGHSSADNFENISGTPYWFKTYSDAWENYGTMVFRQDDSWTKQTADIYQSVSSTTCFTPTSGSNKSGVSTTAPVGPKNIGITNTATTYGSGNGTSGNPYIIKAGTAITCSASAEKIDASTTLEYKFNAGTTSYSTTATNTIIANAVANTNYTATATISATKSSNRSREFNTSTIYYTAKNLYTGLSASKNPNAGSASNPTIAANWVESSNSVSVTAASPATGYDFTGWTSSNGSFAAPSSLNTTFTPTADNAVAVANYAKHDYTISYSPDPAVNFTYTTAPTTAQYGDVVNLTITPDANYTISSVTAVDASSNTVTVSNPSDNNYSFTMPASNVTVTVETALSSMTVTLDADETNHGNIASATPSQEYAYGAATTTIPNLPLGADGYKFMGYYTETGGGGTKLINANGTWITDVDGYTDEDGNWIHGSDVTLYAYYQAATITSLALPGGSLYTVGGSAFTANATVSAFDGNAVVCWQVLNSSSVEVATTFTPASGNSVTVSIPSAPGSYTLKAVLHAGTGCGGSELHTAQTSFTVQGNYTVSITGGTGSANVGEETTATVTADAAAEGKKFDHWNVTGTITGYTVGDANSRTITFKASSNITLTAAYTDRESKTIYFARPSDWTDGLKVYAWQESTKDGEGNPSNKNAAWPGVACTSTTTVKGTTYYYYTYYVDDNGEGDDLTAQDSWDKIIFNDNGNDSEKTSDLTIADGHYYHIKDNTGQNGRPTATASGSASAEDWYVCGRWNVSDYDWGFTHPVDLDGNTSGNVVVGDLTADSKQEFMIYRASTDEWFKYTGDYGEYNAEYAAVIGTPMTLHTISGSNTGNNTFTSYATEYLFTLDITSTSNPVLTLVPNENTPYSATLSKNGHGSLSVGTGAITLKQYIPTTITATPEPGYRFTGWVTTGSVAYAGGTSSSDATASFTATGNGGTITANFSNENIIYFDRSAVNGVWAGSDVYVTFFTNNDHWAEYFEGDVRKERVKMQNWVAGLMSQKMDRIPNTNIYYLYTGGDATQWYMFTDKNMVNGGETWEQAAVARADFSSASGCNMFVVENYVEKSVAKTGFYYGYWMKYHEEDPGVQLCIYSSGSSEHISGSPFNLTTDEIGSTEFTKSVHLSAATDYAIELKGLNGIYYKNKGTMTSKGSSGWEYVEREATRGFITTTAEGDYKFTLSCANQLILSAEYPLDVNDFQIVFNGKVKTTDGSNKIHPSRVIRHLTEAGSQKDTISFFVIKGNDWSLQIQKCNQIDPTITWENVGSAISPATFGDPATGVYNFVVEQTHDGSSNSVSINTKVEKYDGHFYIRSDAAKGGWEGYKKALDNQMIYSNFSRLNSDFDYYHCHYSKNGKSVKFTIANDYSSCVSDTLENDTYTTGAGNLPADASVRFMWDSKTNIISRAYLNGANTTNFLLLEAKGDSLKNFDGTAIAEASTLGSVKFKDMGNWIYQKEVLALPGTRVRLTSNYRFNSDDHIQYFKGGSGEWSETGANTEQIIGGTTTGWEKLRLVYDFKTNHLTSAWLPPTSTIEDEKSINADMLLIRRGQNAAQQLTFGGSGKIANVKTIVGAMEFVKDSIVGRVSHFNGDVIGVGGNRANRELMHYISFPFDVAVNDIYGFGQLNKEWYLQYYDGADRAAKGFFRGDGTTTFWKYMTLSDTLRANVGYSLLLDNDYFNTTGDGTVWNNTISDSIYLYFPSAKELSADSVIKTGTKAIRVPEHKHTSGRTFGPNNLCHDFTDSNWNMMGVPLFQNHTGLEAYFDAPEDDPTDWPGGGKGYFYEWDSIDNNFEIHTAEDYIFKSMHGYMVQYSGSVSFTGASIQPASSVVARRAQKSRENYTMELQLLKENKRVSRTYIELREEACDTFALDEDVYMVYTSHPADLYTYAGNYDVSANVLSMDNHSIPVGIEVHKAGSYTFSMLENFSGAAILVDTQMGTRTNLALSDYTVSLPKGVCDGRFYIEIDLNKMPTAIDGVEGGSLKDGNAHKFIENGIMYILRDGVVYDARGTKVK